MAIPRAEALYSFCLCRRRGIETANLAVDAEHVLCGDCLATDG
jgi:hypothetical protein